MAENDKRLTETLTEGANAPGQSTGHRCPLGTHPWWCSCPTNHHRAWQEDDREYPVPDWSPGIETVRTWSRCGCTPCIRKTINWYGHKQVDEDVDLSYVITAAHKRLEKAEEHDAQVARLLAYRQNQQAKKDAQARQHKGTWEFTLTYSPKAHGWLASEAEAAMRTAIDRLTRYYADEIEEFHAVGERTQAGQPHVHAWYKLHGGRRITTKNFRRAYPIWNEKRKLGRGHEGGHHEPVKRTADFAGYIEKDLDTSWLILNITHEPDEAQADLQEAQDDHPSEADGTACPPDSPAESDDGQLRECS